MYYDCRYLSACETIWRIFLFYINYREPSVERWNFHLEGEEPVIFEDIEDVINKPHIHDTVFSMDDGSRQIKNILKQEIWFTVSFGFDWNFYGSHHIINGLNENRVFQLVGFTLCRLGLVKVSILGLCLIMLRVLCLLMTLKQLRVLNTTHLKSLALFWVCWMMIKSL